MAYTSNKVCHFVGRSLADNAERLKLLCQIIHEGVLLSHKSDNGDFQSRLVNGRSSMNLNGEVYTETRCVCFCDIPDDELNIHIHKYSKFGLGFKKDFIVAQGGRPVIYIPDKISLQEANAGILKYPVQRFFPELTQLATFTSAILGIANIHNEITNAYNKNKTAQSELKVLTDVLDTSQVFCNPKGLWGAIFTIINTVTTMNQFVKVFDPSLDDNDPNNYYMEREWRSLNDVFFSVDDIVNVYLPDDDIFVTNFVNEFPNLKDKVFRLPYGN